MKLPNLITANTIPNYFIAMEFLKNDPAITIPYLGLNRTGCIAQVILDFNIFNFNDVTYSFRDEQIWSVHDNPKSLLKLRSFSGFFRYSIVV